MNVAASFDTGQRRAVSPYARRLAREHDIALDDLTGSGPNGRIVAVDVLSYQPPVEEKLSGQAATAAAISTFAFSVTVSLADFYRLAAEAARSGLTIDVEDAVHRATRTALTVIDRAGHAEAAGIALEADGRQILISTGGGLSIGTERKLRLEAQDDDCDVSNEPAFLSLRVLPGSRVIPASLPLMPGRKMRLVVIFDEAKEQLNALLSADASAITESDAVEMLEAFATGLENPLALMA